MVNHITVTAARHNLNSVVIHIPVSIHRDYKSGCVVIKETPRGLMIREGTICDEKTYQITKQGNTTWTSPNYLEYIGKWSYEIIKGEIFLTDIK